MDQETKHSKAIENMQGNCQVINEKYQSFLKEKIIMQTERDQMAFNIRQLEGLVQHSQMKCQDEIANYKNQFNIQIEELIDQLGRV